MLNHSVNENIATSPKGKSYSSNGPSPIKCDLNSIAQKSQNHQSPLADTKDTKPVGNIVNRNQSPLSSCSNSPSSVRINQNYKPNNVETQSPITSSVSSKIDKTKANDRNDGDESEHLILGNANNDTVFSPSRIEYDQFTDYRQNREADLDNADDADSKPLLESSNTNGTGIVGNSGGAGKRNTGKYTDHIANNNLDDDNNETETLINNGESA